MKLVFFHHEEQILQNEQVMGLVPGLSMETKVYQVQRAWFLTADRGKILKKARENPALEVPDY